MIFTHSSDVHLFTKIVSYKKMAEHFERYLSSHPLEWSRFQDQFNRIVDEISNEFLLFEQNHIQEYEMRVYRLKKIFEKRWRHYFIRGEYVRWSFEKPFGYPGDFKIIDDIYVNNPRTRGFDRLFDNCFLELAASKATRERKEDFKKIILEFVILHRDTSIRIMNLGCGSAREIKELLESGNSNIFNNVIFDCYDFDYRALDFAKTLLKDKSNVNFFHKNVIRLALSKNIHCEIPFIYDLIYSTGLFDYLDERVAIRLVANLKRLLKVNGELVISNYRDKYNNSSAYLMEWVAGWNLIYRDEKEFKKIFLMGGFPEEKIKIVPQKSMVMQYCFAHNI